MSSHLRDFGLIRSTIWQSEKFLALSRLEARLAYIWLHTGQKTCAGVLRIGPAHMADELDFFETVDNAAEIFDQLEEVGLIVRQRPFVIITKFVKGTPVKSKNHAVAAFRECLSLPECPAKELLFAELRSQEGFPKLAAWRDKNGEPSSVVFDIHAYAQELETSGHEPYPNPSNTLPEPIGMGSGKHKPSKEKEEGKQSPGFRKVAPPVNAANTKGEDIAEKERKSLGPRPETIALVRKQAR